MNADVERLLVDEPHLRPFVEPDDCDLDAARERFTLSLADALQRMADAGVTVRTRYQRGDVLTTSYAGPS